MTRARVPLAIAALGALLVWLAPAERTLGDGIRWVYVHVGLVWAGTVALGAAGVAGVALVATGWARLCAWVHATWRAGLAAFALGVGFSMIAARVNWGGVFLAEPRMAASLRILAVAAIAQVTATWIARPRATGLLAAAALALLAWDVGGAELVMHPRDPVRTATSSAIQWMFALAFAVAAALTAWMIAALGARSRTR